MSLRHAVLAALLDTSASGYELTKIFDASVANFWTSFPQQLYAELNRLEADGLIEGHEVVQQRRPNKRVFSISQTGRQALRDFIDIASKPTVVRDDLLVKVHAADAGDLDSLVRDLHDRADLAEAKAQSIEGVLAAIRGEQSEEQYLARGLRIGPYLTALRGLNFERDTAAWCYRAADTLLLRAQATVDR